MSVSTMPRCVFDTRSDEFLGLAMEGFYRSNKLLRWGMKKSLILRRCEGTCSVKLVDHNKYAHSLSHTQLYIGGEIGGGGAEPPQFLDVYTFQHALHDTTVRTLKASETLSKSWKSQIFLGEYAPRPDYCLLCLKPKPPHFCRSFSAPCLPVRLPLNHLSSSPSIP